MRSIASRLRSQIRKFAAARDANIAITFALACMPVAGLMGAAVDYSRGNAAKVALQAALDAAALHTVQDARTLTTSEISARAINLATANFDQPDTSNLVVTGVFDTSTEILTVTGSVNVATVFMSMVPFSVPYMPVNAVSKAQPKTQTACLIALDTSSAGSFVSTGSGTVEAPNCGIQVNSSSSTALQQSGSGSIKAKTINVVGNYSGSGYTPLPKINQASVTDPLINITEPTIPACTNTGNGNINGPTLAAGRVYCDGTVKINGSVALAAGTYYFKNVTLETTGAGASLEGTGVMLYFKNSTWDMTGGVKMKLTAPSSGTYQGIALFGSRADTTTPSIKLKGNADYVVDGTIYLPNQKLELTGTSDLTVSSKSGYVIAKRFSYSGTSSFTFDAITAVPTAMIAASTKLVQ